MRLRTLVASATLSAGILLPTAAHAQTADDPYTKTAPSEVLAEQVTREDSAAVAPAAVERTAPSSTLPVTGTDVVGLTVIGLTAIAGGTFLVRRSRKPAVAQTA